MRTCGAALVCVLLPAVVACGSTAPASGEGHSAPTPHTITRVLRTADSYFERRSDVSIRRAGHVVCGMLRQGRSIEEVVSLEVSQGLPSGPTGELIATAVSIDCPQFEPAMQQFIARHA
jgi:hypothetical protein